MSRSNSRANSAMSAGRPASSRSRAASAMLVNERAASAASIVRSLQGSRPASTTSMANDRISSARSIPRSRPGSSKSVAWAPAEEEVVVAPVVAAATPMGDPESAMGGQLLSKELEEELNREGMSTKEEETIGCWQRFLGAISSLWDTTDMKLGEDKEEMVKTTLREFVIYLAFLAILCIVTLSTMSPTMFNYNNQVQTMYESTNYTNIGQIADVWTYLTNDFVGSTYWETWYNQGTDPYDFQCPGSPNATGPCPIDLEDRMIMYSNKMLGVPRLRQLRVTNDSCSIPSQFKNSINVCYDGYSVGIEDKNEFLNPGSVRNFTSATAWTYQTVRELSGSNHWGQLATYSGAGSVQDLTQTSDETLAILLELQEGLWIGRGTRYVSLDFTLYNANINLFCVVNINFEFPQTGGVVTDGRFSVVKLLRYITPWEYAIMGFEFTFAIFVLYYLVEEILEMKTMRFQYFMSFWNLTDLFVIVISIATLSFNVYCYVTVARMLQALLAEPDLYADFDYLQSWSKTFQDAAALTVFVGWIKIFKFISFNKTMIQLTVTIARCAPDVGAFSVMFFIVFFAYAQVGYLLFGAFMQPYNNLIEASYSLLRLVLGDFDFPSLEAANSFWGPVFFITFVFFVFFVLMNMFIAIINDTYSEVRVEVEQRREEFQVADYVMRGYNNAREAMYQRDKLIDIKHSVKLSSDDGVVTYEEVRDHLRKLNFSDLEIEIFCSRYDKDGNFQFDLDEINAIEQNLGDQMANQDHLTLESERKTAGLDVNADYFELAASPKMNTAQFAVLEKRVNTMEAQMRLVVGKVDDVLKQLDRVVEDGTGPRQSQSATSTSSRASRAASSTSRGRGAEEEEEMQDKMEEIDAAEENAEEAAEDLVEEAEVPQDLDEALE